jgi:hypothetical protein
LTGAWPQWILSADLNNDNKLDLATANYVDNDVSLLLGNGDGTFQNQLGYSVGFGPSSMAVGAFRNKNALDLAVTNFLDNNVAILLNSCL